VDREQVEEVFYRIDTSSLDGKKLLLLSPDDLRTLRENIEAYQDLLHDVATSPGLNTLLTAINQQVSAAMVSHLTQGFLGLEVSQEKGEQKAQLSLTFVKSLLEQMELALSSQAFSYRSLWADLFGSEALANDGFLVSDDKRFVFLLADPRERGDGFNARQQSIDAIRHHIAELRHEFPGVHAGVTGEKALGNDEMMTAQADSSLASVVSLVGVGLLYLLFFRNIRRTLILVATVAVGLVWTLGALTLIVGHLTIISIFVASILIGLADDRIIYLLSRYEEERDLGRSFRQAIHLTFTHAAPGIVAAACTNALAFYAMMLADFRGIQELGLIAGSGILLSCVVTLTFLPALLTLTEGKRLWQLSMRHEGWLARGFAWWELTVQRHRWLVLFLATAASVLGLCALPTLAFDYDLLHLQARGTESVTWEQRIVAHSGQSSWFALAAAPSLAEAAQEAAQFAALPSVEKVETVASLVPEGQEERMRLVHALQPFFANLPSTFAAPQTVNSEELEQALKRIQFKLQGDNGTWDPQKKPSEYEIAEVRRLLKKILARFETLSTIDVTTALERLQQPLFRDFAEKWSLLRANLHPSAPLSLDDVPAQLRARFVSADGKLFLLQIYPRKDIWEWEPLTEFIGQLRRVDPNVTGSPVIGYESIRAIKRGYMEGGLYAAAAILVAAFLTLRRGRDTLIAMLPVVCGMLWIADLMWLGHLTFNLANLVVVPITIGIGVESGVYLVRRAREETREGEGLVRGSTGQAVTLFSLSTMVGFGSLMLARHYGIFSMGLLLTLAVGSVLLVSLTVLPLLLQLPPSGQGYSPP
jgi:hopanoid biosynthesis associated RND transporter like protein HpnN